MKGVGRAMAGVGCAIALVAGLMVFFTTVSRSDRERLDSRRAAEAARPPVAPPLGEIQLRRPVRRSADLMAITGVGVTPGGWVPYTSSAWRVAFPGQPKRTEIGEVTDPNDPVKSFEVSHSSQAGLFVVVEVAGLAGWIKGLDHGSRIWHEYISESNGTVVEESDVQLAGATARRIKWINEGVATTTYVVVPSGSLLIFLEAYGATAVDTDAYAGAFAMVPA